MTHDDDDCEKASWAAVVADWADGECTGSHHARFTCVTVIIIFILSYLIMRQSADRAKQASTSVNH
jgi:hypothetical protein